MDDRFQEVKRLRESGMTFDQIGAKFGVSRQRAYQLYFRATHPVSDEQRNNKRIREERNNLIFELFNLLIPVAEIGLIMNIDQSGVRNILKAYDGLCRDAKAVRTESIRRLSLERKSVPEIVKEVYGIDLTSKKE